MPNRHSESNLDDQDVPLGSRFGEKKSPRLKGKDLPPLGGSSKLPPLGGNKGLPPLGSNKLSDGEYFQFTRNITYNSVLLFLEIINCFLI